MNTAVARADVEILRARVTAHIPQLACLPFRVLSSGWDSDAVVADERLVFKFPRHTAAETRLRREASLLQLVREHSTLPVPDISLIEADPVFSCHAIIRGNQLLPEHYDGLPETKRDRLASDVARFLVSLHAIPVTTALAAGAVEVAAFAPVQSVGDIAQSLAPADGGADALRVVADYQCLLTDPLGKVFGHFDCHGWNMAYEAERRVLSGIFDFGDSGIGEAHREFVYPSLLSPEHAFRVLGHYERWSGRSVDRNRVATLIGYHRLMEMAEYRNNPEMFDFATINWKKWCRFAIKTGLV